MLVLSRAIGEEIAIGDDIVVRLVMVAGSRAQLAIAAPGNVPVNRMELHREIQRDGRRFKEPGHSLRR